MKPILKNNLDVTSRLTKMLEEAFSEFSIPRNKFSSLTEWTLSDVQKFSLPGAATFPSVGSPLVAR